MLISRDLPIYGDCAAATCGDDDFNAGVWAVRNSVAGRKLMDAWWELFRADAWSKKANGSWVCVDTDEATGYSEPCEWGQEMFEQGAFVRHVLPRHRAEIRQATWMVLNNPCATTELIGVATTPLASASAWQNSTSDLPSVSATRKYPPSALPSQVSKQVSTSM